MCNTFQQPLYIMYLFIFLVIPSNSADIYVSAASNCGSSCVGTEALPYPTIQQGLDDFRGGTLIIMSGAYTGNGNTNISISQSYTTITTQYPNDPSQTIIDCENESWGLELLSDVYHITGLTFQNCVGASRSRQNFSSQTLGGALYLHNLGLANINYCIFENNKADFGGAIYIYAAAVNLANTVIRNNNAEDTGGGVHVQNANLKLLDETLIHDNSAKEHGGGIYSKSSTIQLYNKSEIKSNSADDKGRNIYCDNGHVNLYDDSDIDGNNANYIVCVSCDIKEYNSNHELEKDLCPSSQPTQPSNDSKKEERNVAVVVTVLIIFIIVAIIACCYFYKKKVNGGDKYEGLLET